MPEVEHHPLPPFLPEGARLLMLGSFPPPHRRWCMDFFYPNRTNMMWEIFGEVFFGDRLRLVDDPNRTFRRADIERLLSDRGIAVYDTATAVRRLSGNASDKDLEIVCRTDIPALLARLPRCRDIVCTGQKSFSVLAEDYGATVPPMGAFSSLAFPPSAALPQGRAVRLWRMPSSSRAYPMPLPDKAAHYRRMMQQAGIL